MQINVEYKQIDVYKLKIEKDTFSTAKMVASNQQKYFVGIYATKYYCFPNKTCFGINTLFGISKKDYFSSRYQPLTELVTLFLQQLHNTYITVFSGLVSFIHQAFTAQSSKKCIQPLKVNCGTYRTNYCKFRIS